ncbi:hypothetical protein JCM3766R1_001122 [Sporobolomyces carnicolor]
MIPPQSAGTPSLIPHLDLLSSSPPTHFDLTDGTTQPSFDLLVVGCGGGPLETNLSCYLVKSREQSWTNGCAAIEGGSTIGAVASLVERYPESFEGFNLDLGVDENDSKETVGVGRDGGGKCAGKVWESIKSFSITHSHLDHIAGLVISSAAVQLAAKNVYGLPSTIKNLESVMDFGVWPNLGTRDSTGSMRGKAYLWREIHATGLETLQEPRFPLATGLTSIAHQISHGTDPVHSSADSKESYVSTAFFVRNEETLSEFLFFGDVEPDSISCDPRTRKVWEATAPKIVDSKLNTIFLECSYPSSQPKDKLFGHLSPPFVLEELQVLSEYVQEERERRKLGRATEPLEGVHVVIQHIKDDIFTPDIPSPDASKPKRPEPLELTNTKAAVNDETASPFSPLSMSPPIATVPLRRPSMQLSHFSFPSSSSLSSPHPSPGISRRGSLYPPPSSSSYFPSSFASPSRKSSASSTLAPVVDEDKQFGRRNSTPGGFKFGSTRRNASPSNRVEPATEVGVAGPEFDDAPNDAAAEESDLVEETMHERIERELNNLETEAKTGVRFVIARQGMRLVF